MVVNILRSKEAFIASALFGITLATIDINLPQFKYLANSLRPDECRRLYAALEDPEFDISLNLDATERKVPVDIPCLALLLHWSSTVGEGRGATHEMLSHRLRQLKRNDLADWLSATVFHQLAIDLDQSMKQDPLKSMAQEESLDKVLLSLTGEPMAESGDTDEWTPVDTLLCVLVLVALFIILTVVAGAVINLFRTKHSAQTLA